MRKLIPLITVVLLVCSACEPAAKKKQETIVDDIKKVREEVILKDHGANPLVINIEDYTLENQTFRTAIWTGEHLQLTVMSIPVGSEVGLEVHYDIEQFLRIEDGKAKVLMGDNENELTFERIASDDDVILVPTGKWHNIINIGDEPLKLYSIYAKPEHPYRTVHLTKEDSDADHHDH
ncbi:MAG TPA: cupin domain-containing protein [Bacteroidales bacterium]|nr:cupin domain-containing protein [Bacteroidales bacterium]